MLAHFEAEGLFDEPLAAPRPAVEPDISSGSFGGDPFSSRGVPSFGSFGFRFERSGDSAED